MNEEQVKSLIRSLVSSLGGLVAGWFAAKGWLTSDQVTSVMNSPIFLFIGTTAGAAIWGLIVHKQSNAVAVVDAIAKQPESPVRGIIMEQTPEGRALADSLPGNTTVTAGTPAAVAIAKPSGKDAP